jgi:hypothetical protein
MIHGDEVPLVDTKERAKLHVMLTLTEGAERADGVPATMRAMYVLKTAEARNVLLGEPSSFIEQEAALRGVTAQVLAQLICDTSEQLVNLELTRVKIGLAIDAAEDETGVVEALAAAGLRLPDEVVQV